MLQLLIPILLLTLIYLIKTNGNCLLTVAVSVGLIVLLGNHIRQENFQASGNLFLEDKNDPIVISQMKQNLELENLEQNIGLVKSMLQDTLEEKEEKKSNKILIANSCVLSPEINTPEINNDTGDMPVIPGLNVNRNQMGGV
jgi:hypothetical protein